MTLFTNCGELDANFTNKMQGVQQKIATFPALW